MRDRKTLNTSDVPREKEGFLKTKGEDDRGRRREYQHQKTRIRGALARVDILG